MILSIALAEVCGPHSLQVTFNDGTSKRVNLMPLLHGPIFEPLLNPECFARVVVDPHCRTVVWPNGADLVPEALRELPQEDTTPSGSRRVE